MKRTMLGRVVAAVCAVFALALTVPVAANAADSTSTLASAEALAREVPLTVKANEDVSNHSFVAIRLANYAQAQITTAADGTKSLTGLDVVDNGFATKVAAAITDAGINTSAKAGSYAYDATNPMPWVMENLLQAATSPWEDDAPATAPNLRAFMTKLRTQFLKSDGALETLEAGKFYTMPAAKATSGSTPESPAYESTAQVMPGFYMVLDMTAAEGGEPKLADAASIPMANGTGVYTDTAANSGELLSTLVKSADKSYTLGEVDYKGSHVTVDKQVTGPQTGAAAGDTAVADLGQTVTFTLTTTVPNYTGYDAFRFQLSDTMSKGLTFGQITSVTVKDGENEAKTLMEGADYTKVDDATVDDNGNGSDDKDYTFTVLFAPKVDNGATVSDIAVNAQMKEKFPVGATVTVTYTATLDKDATILSTGNPNSVTVLYSHNPNDTSDLEKSPESRVKVYTGQMKVLKTDVSGKALAGAEFTVTRDGDNAALELVAEDAAAGVYRVWDGKETAAHQATMTTPTSGTLTIKGLSGTYTVTETKAPAGFSGTFLPSVKATVAVTAPNATTCNVDPTPATGCDATVAVSEGAGDTFKLVDVHTTQAGAATEQLDVKNVRTLLDMPKTGAAWLAVYAIGALIFGAGGTVLLMRARRS